METTTRAVVTVDITADAAYVQFTDAPVALTVEVTDAISVDFDEFRVVVGIEILGTKTTIPFSRLTEEAHVPSSHVDILRFLLPTIHHSVLTSGSEGMSEPDDALVPVG